MFIQHATVPKDSVLASELARLGERVRMWTIQLTDPPTSPGNLVALAEDAGDWSRRLLVSSGLLPTRQEPAA